MKKKLPQNWKEQRRRRAASNAAVIRQLKARPCADCQNTFPPECMDFDHARGTKSFGISQAVCKGDKKLPTILGELEKCDLVCANCHRIRTARRRRETPRPTAHRTHTQPIENTGNGIEPLNLHSRAAQLTDFSSQ